MTTKTKNVGVENEMSESRNCPWSSKYVPRREKKKKTKGGKLGETEANDEEEVWSQEQQKSLEAALSQYPKGTSERWDRIAGKVEGKSKEQCMLRFKHLAEQIKKKKEN